MFRRTLCTLLLALPTVVSAQMRRGSPVASEPDYWVGVSLGYMDGFTIANGDAGGTSSFGYTTPIRATIEKTLQRGVTVGLGAGYATASLDYTSGFGGGGCGGYCQAQADIAQYLVFLHGGASGGVGFHGIYNVEAGVTSISNYRERSSQASIGQATSNDFTFGLGGGIGYSVSPVTDLYVAEMLDFILHPQANGGVSQSAPRPFTVRAGFRYGV